MKRAVCLLCIMIFLCGCLSTREQMMRAGYDPAYIDGYVDGESSGYNAAGNPWYPFAKNTHRFDADSQYRQGWNDGFMVAKTRYESVQRSMR